MKYQAFACDFDGTLAHDGEVAETTLAALRRLRASGRAAILVTGRQLNDLLAVFPAAELFERIAAENGALTYDPATGRENLLAEKPPPFFIEALRKRGVAPLSLGRVIMATSRPHENTVLEIVRDLRLEFQVIFNKDSVMILPDGIDKAAGLEAALNELGISFLNAVGIGDGENDEPFMAKCGFSAAVANAVPALKRKADMITSGDHGSGVVELIDRILLTDLAEFNSRD